ncbi:MAG TPA: hypothetical protein VFO37_09990, partial [Chitinophagaceae bacterium]|nr:hypothetical protein [Chitinophagaceae bacterium]
NPFGGGRAIAGMIVVIVGTLLLAREVGADIPYWIFSWHMLLIAFGLYLGARHSFRNPVWLIPVAIGSAFLIEDLVPEIRVREYFWPLLIIGVGLVMIIRSRRRNSDMFKAWELKANESTAMPEGFFETVTIFGENKKQILSKDFKGGESVCVFGGVEINLTQADINGRIPLELVQVFGGTKLIVPPHWKIETEEVVAVFGGLNDKRQVQNVVTDQTKVLVLKGTTFFGGIDIKSY